MRAAELLEKENAVLAQQQQPPQQQQQQQQQQQPPRGANVSRPTRRTREEMKHEEEMRVLAHQLEKLKQEAALSEAKEALAAERTAKLKAAKHTAWLEDQKQELQALKLKQALLRERKLLDASAGTVRPSGDLSTGPAATGAITRPGDAVMQSPGQKLPTAESDRAVWLARYLML